MVAVGVVHAAMQHTHTHTHTQEALFVCGDDGCEQGVSPIELPGTRCHAPGSSNDFCGHTTTHRTPRPARWFALGLARCLCPGAARLGFSACGARRGGVCWCSSPSRHGTFCPCSGDFSQSSSRCWAQHAPAPAGALRHRCSRECACPVLAGVAARCCSARFLRVVRRCGAMPLALLWRSVSCSLARSTPRPSSLLVFCFSCVSCVCSTPPTHSNKHPLGERKRKSNTRHSGD